MWGKTGSFEGPAEEKQHKPKNQSNGATDAGTNQIEYKQEGAKQARPEIVKSGPRGVRAG